MQMLQNCLCNHARSQYRSQYRISQSLISSCRNKYSNSHLALNSMQQRHLRSFSRHNSSSSSSSSSSSIPTFASRPSTHLIPSDAEIPLPPSQKKLSNNFSMQVILLGYGVGVFEFELLRNCPQLNDHSFTFTPAARKPAVIDDDNASTRFDLSAYRPEDEAAVREAHASSDLKSSWASSAATQENMTRRRDNPQFDENMLFNDRSKSGESKPVPLTQESMNNLLQKRSMPEKPVVKNQPTPQAVFQGNSRIIIHSSVMVYQNCLFCWSPETFEDVTVDSLSFLRTLTPRPELIVIGTGSSASRRLPPDVAKFLSDMRIGCETMDSGNAIATYNILTDEGRTVMAVLIKRPEQQEVVQRLSRSQQMRKQLGYWNPEDNKRQ